MKSHSDEQQETVDAENNRNHDGSDEAGRDDSSLLDQMRTCSVEFIRSNPALRNIYDSGFVAGFYGKNLSQLEAAVSRKSTVDVISDDAPLGSPLEAVGAECLAAVAAMNTAIESALDTALYVAEISSTLVSAVARGLYHEQP